MHLSVVHIVGTEIIVCVCLLLWIHLRDFVDEDRECVSKHDKIEWLFLFYYFYCAIRLLTYSCGHNNSTAYLGSNDIYI